MVDMGTNIVGTNKLDFTMLDAQGHRGFTRNMISGVAEADCGLLVVSVTMEEFGVGFAAANLVDEYGFGSVRGQTSDHIVYQGGRACLN